MPSLYQLGSRAIHLGYKSQHICQRRFHVLLNGFKVFSFFSVNHPCGSSAAGTGLDFISTHLRFG